MIELTTWQASGTVNKLNGFDVFCTEAGNANNDTVLLIHGFPTASWDWQAIWSTLAKDCHLVALDMPGFGFSEKPAGHRYTIMEQADTVDALVKHHKIKSLHVLAHDYGDTVAQELLARQNAGVGEAQWLSCCFLNGGLFPEQHRALFIQKLLLSPLGPLIAKLQTRDKFAKTLASTFGPNTKPSEVEIDAFWELINYNNGIPGFARLIRYISDRIEHKERWQNAMKQSKIPLALINGSVDPISGAHMVEFYRQVIGEPAYLAQLPDIGHYPQVEAPAEVLKHYQVFLNLINGKY